MGLEEFTEIEDESESKLERASDLEDRLDELVELALELEESRDTVVGLPDRVAEIVVAEMLLDKVGDVTASRWEGTPRSKHVSFSLKRHLNKYWNNRESALEYKERHIDEIGGIDGITADEWVDSRVELDREADHYIYVLEMTRAIDDEIYYYIGETPDVESRIRDHKRRNGDFSKPTVSFITGEDIMPGKDHGTFSEIDINLVDTEEIYKIEGESKFHFNARVSQQERVKALEVALENDTTNVLGGR